MYKQGTAVDMVVVECVVDLVDMVVVECKVDMATGEMDMEIFIREVTTENTTCSLYYKNYVA